MFCGWLKLLALTVVFWWVTCEKSNSDSTRRKYLGFVWLLYVRCVCKMLQNLRASKHKHCCGGYGQSCSSKAVDKPEAFTWQTEKGVLQFFFLVLFCVKVPRVDPGQSPLIPSLPHLLYPLVSFFSLSYSCFIYLLAFHPFPFYQNSPTPFPRPDVVGGD